MTRVFYVLPQDHPHFGHGCVYRNMARWHNSDQVLWFRCRSKRLKKGEGSGKHSLERAGDLLLLVLAAVICAVPTVRVAVVIPWCPHQAMLVEVAGCVQALVCGHAQPGHLQAARETLSASENPTETRVCDWILWNPNHRVEGLIPGHWHPSVIGFSSPVGCTGSPKDEQGGEVGWPVEQNLWLKQGGPDSGAVPWLSNVKWGNGQDGEWWVDISLPPSLPPQPTSLMCTNTRLLKEWRDTSGNYRVN